MKDFIRRWFGIAKLQDLLYNLIRDQEDLNTELLRVNGELRIHNAELGRIIAKLDPMYGIDELDPVRKAQSDALGKRVIDQLEGEDWARQHAEGKV